MTTGTRIFALLAALILAPVSPDARAAEDLTPADSPQLVVHMLDYIAIDYPRAVENGRVVAPSEFAEQVEFAAAVVTRLRALPTPDNGEPGRGVLLASALHLETRIAARAPAEEIASIANVLKRETVAAWRLRIGPRTAPDLVRGAALYDEHCAACHGATGHGDGPAASGLAPAPASFHDRPRMAQRSLHALYNTITLGVNGTAMTSFWRLAEADRWALAFHVAGLAPTPAEVAAGKARGASLSERNPLRDLAAVGAATAAGLGEDAPILAWLTRHPEAIPIPQTDALGLARRRLGESVTALREGRRSDAQRLAVASYLEGFELAEPALDAVDRPLRQRIENEMMNFRKSLVLGDAASVSQRGQALDALLAEAGESLAEHRLNSFSAGLSAFGILFREGLEAILILAAIAAGVTAGPGRSAKPAADAARAMRFIHAGWIGALLAGAVTWLMARELVAISGATREMTEGISALLASAILLYVGFWLHGRAHAADWQRTLATRVDSALSRGTLGLLAGVSFLAVYREAFETVLFFQALASQSDPQATGALAIGAAAAALVLGGLAWAIFRAGLRLPLALFFRLSAALLAGLAVVFAGQGIAALQEAGSIGIDPVGSWHLPALGVFPTVQTITAQLLAIGLIAAALVRPGRRRARPGGRSDPRP